MADNEGASTHNVDGEQETMQQTQELSIAQK